MGVYKGHTRTVPGTVVLVEVYLNHFLTRTFKDLIS
jgi:hypothetical protein